MRMIAHRGRWRVRLCTEGYIFPPYPRDISPEEPNAVYADALVVNVARPAPPENLAVKRYSRKRYFFTLSCRGPVYGARAHTQGKSSSTRLEGQRLTSLVRTSAR